MAEVTITVERADLERVLDSFQGTATRPEWYAAHRIRKAIPRPPWEPTEEQVVAYLRAFGYGDNVGNRVAATHYLERLHEAGLL